MLQAAAAKSLPSDAKHVAFRGSTLHFAVSRCGHHRARGMYLPVPEPPMRGELANRLRELREEGP